jgi:hypothetical protein
MGTVCVVFMMYVCSSAFLLAQGGKVEWLRGFKSVDFYDQPAPNQTNRLKTIATGARAVPQPGGVVLVDKMRIDTIEVDGRTNMVVQAPECLFDQNRRVAYSTGHVEVVSASGQFFMEGLGFLCSHTNSRVVISNRVHTVIRQDLMKTAAP